MKLSARSLRENTELLCASFAPRELASIPHRDLNSPEMTCIVKRKSAIVVAIN